MASNASAAESGMPCLPRTSERTKASILAVVKAPCPRVRSLQRQKKKAGWNESKAVKKKEKKKSAAATANYKHSNVDRSIE